MLGPVVIIVVFIAFATESKICRQRHKDRQVQRSYKHGNRDYIHSVVWWIQHAANAHAEIGSCGFVQIARQRLGCGSGS